MRRQQIHIPLLMVVIALLTGRPMLYAEVLADIEVTHSFMVEDLSAFPDHDIFYKYYSASNDAMVEVPVSPGIPMHTEAGAEAIFIARKKKGGGDALIANRSLAGVELTQDPDLTGITDIVTIESITDEAFVIRVNNYERYFSDGSMQQVKMQSNITQMLNAPVDKEMKIVLALSAPIFVLISMFMFQRSRRRRLKLAVGKVIRLKKRIQIRSVNVMMRNEDKADGPMVEQALVEQ